MKIMKKYLRPVYASSEAGIYKIPVVWKMRAVMSVPACSLKEAVRIVNSHEYDLPAGEYVEDSYKIDYDRLEE